MNRKRIAFVMQIRYLLSLLLVFVLGVPLYAQNQVTGKVTDSNQGPLPFVYVVVKGTTIATSTQDNGTYRLNNVPNGATLVFSNIGFVTLEVPVNSRSVVNVTMEEDALMLDDVVVTALGMKRSAKALGYAVQEVSGENIAAAGGTSMLNSLAGKAAGVNITSASGALGSSTRIQIRGFSTLAGDNQPLFVVDGTPISNTTYATYNVDLGSGGNDINPESIASISILKGASATALYGSRGMNGVVLITTKQGTPGRKDLGVSFSSTITFDKISTLPRYQNEYGQGGDGAEFIYKRDGAGMTYQEYARTTYAYRDGLGGGINDATDESWGPRMDIGLKLDQFHGKDQPWVSHPNNIRDLFQTGITFTNSLTVRAANDNVAGRLTYSNDLMTGTTPTTENKRNSIDANTVITISKFFNADLKISYLNANGNMPTQGYESGNPIQMAGWFGRQVDTKLLKDKWDQLDERGNPYNWISMYHNNPYFTFHTRRTDRENNRVRGNFSLNFTFTDYLKLMLRMGTDANFMNSKRVRHSRDAENAADNGTFGIVKRSSAETNLDALLMFDKTFGDLSVNATLGGNWRDNSSATTIVEVTKLIVPDFYATSNSNGPANDFSSTTNHLRSNSVFGAVNFGFKNYLFLDITGRNDWSSTLPSSNWSYFYPSVGLGFIFTEAFKLKSNILSFGKLRASWAQVGNATGAYQLLDTWAASTAINGYSQFSYSNTMRNPNLKPEMKTNIEIGADLRFFKNRLNLDVTWYNDKTINQIVNMNLSRATGFSSMTVNSGKIENKGIEVILSGKILQNRNGFNWTSTVNWSTVKNKVVHLYGTKGELGYIGEYGIGSMWSVYSRAVVGKPMGELYTVGIKRNDDGVPIVGANGRYQNAGTIRVGNINPDWIGSWNNEFSYKNFNLSFLVKSTMGGDMFAVTGWFGAYSGVLDVTTKDGIRENGFVAKGVLADGTPNTRAIDPYIHFADWYSMPEQAVFDASYVKLSEAVFGYTWRPKDFYFKTLNFSIVGRNLALLYIHKSNFAGIDPETTGFLNRVSDLGFEQYAYPPTRSFGFKLSLSF